MGSGLGVYLKNIAPLSIYVGGLWAMLMAMGGKPRYALLLLTFLIPLRNVVERVQEFPGGTQFLDLLVFSLVISCFAHSAKRNGTAMAPSAINWVSIGLVVYLLISVLLGGLTLNDSITFDVHDPRVQDWKNFCLLPILFFVALNATSTRKDIWMMFGVMCVTMLVMDYYMVNQVRWYSSLESRSKITASFQFLGPNEVGAFFNEYTVILLTVYFAMKRSRNKYLLLGLILLNVYSIVFTYSRAAIGGLAVGMFILFALKNQKYLVPLVLAACLWQVVLPEKAVERIKETKGEYGQLDESSQRRLNIWHVALDLFGKNPVSGIGYGVFRFMGFDLGDTHNIYVKILVEQGLIGLLLFLGTIIGFMREGFKLYQKGEEDDMTRALGLGLFICMFTLMFNNFFGDRWSYLEPNGYLWLFGGMVARMNIIAGQPKPKEAVAVEEVKEQSNLKEVFAKPRKKKKVRYYDM